MPNKPKRDLIGKRFGRLEVIEVEKILINNKLEWRFKCICDCQRNNENPKYTYVRRDHLIKGDVLSCGCLARELSSDRETIDITGNRYGNLIVIGRGENTANGSTRWWCQCDCGSDPVLVTKSNLISGGTVSCGCYHRKNAHDLLKKYNKYDLSGEYGIGYTFKGEEFYFDLEDYEKIKDYCWSINNQGYVVTKNNDDQYILMHRLILDLKQYTTGNEVDHIKHRKYDNRKSQLRIVTRSQNQMNTSIRVNNTSGKTGINWSKSHNKWQVRISKNKSRVEIGYFDSFQDAIKARERAEKKYHKEWAYLYSKNMNTNGGTMSKVTQIKELIDILNNTSDQYYNYTPIMTDNEWDGLYAQLEELERNTKIVYPNSPTQHAGYRVSKEIPKVKHNHPMLSLKKCHSQEELLKFAKDKNCILSVKCDGLTTSLHYKNGILIGAESRGDGIVGGDVLQNVLTIKNIPHTIPCTDELIIDGETIIDWNSFNEINSNLPDKQEKFKHPRNLASASLNVLDSEIAAQRNMRFIAWRVIKGLNDQSVFCALRDAEQLGFEIVPMWTFRNCGNNKIQLSELLSKLRDVAENLNIPYDGAVLSYDDIKYCESLGRTEKYFKHSISYKYEDSLYKTTLKDIEWKTSRTGLINPIANFAKVIIDGSEVARATLHNISYIENLQLGVGDTILIYKANKIIPKVHDNLTLSNTWTYPKACPTCGYPTEVHNENGSKTLHCTNPACKAKLINRLVNFVSRKCMNIDGLSEETLTKFVEWGWIKNLFDVYNLTPHYKELAKVNGFGTRSVKKLQDAIENSKDVELEHFIAALSIPGIGTAQAKELAKKFKTWDTFDEAGHGSYDFSVLDGFGEVANKNIHSWFYAMYQEDRIPQLVRNLHFIDSNDNEINNSLKGMTFVITGSLNHFENRDVLKRELESRGAKVSGSVSVKTSCLINNDINSTSSKNKKAIQLNIPIVNEEYIVGLLNQ